MDYKTEILFDALKYESEASCDETTRQRLQSALADFERQVAYEKTLEIDD